MPQIQVLAAIKLIRNGVIALLKGRVMEMYLCMLKKKHRSDDLNLTNTIKNK